MRIVEIWNIVPGAEWPTLPNDRMIDHDIDDFRSAAGRTLTSVHEEESPAPLFKLETHRFLSHLHRATSFYASTDFAQELLATSDRFFWSQLAWICFAMIAILILILVAILVKSKYERARYFAVSVFVRFSMLMYDTLATTCVFVMVTVWDVHGSVETGTFREGFARSSAASVTFIVAIILMVTFHFCVPAMLIWIRYWSLFHAKSDTSHPKHFLSLGALWEP
jgi:hypothetical protein